MLRDRIFNLSTADEVDAFLAQYPTSVVFKAGTCHKTMQGFGFLQEKVEPREDLPVAIIRVVEQRPASNRVAELTGIVHHSPQVILFKDGQAVFDLDNWSITPEALDAGFAHVPASDATVAAGAASSSDLQPYLDLLQAYLSGSMDYGEFEHRYTHTFRADASLRSRDEVEVLGSIFGDVDRHIAIHQVLAGHVSEDQALRARAEQAYAQLKQMVHAVPA